MPFFHRKNLWRSVPRRLAGALALVSYCLAGIGLPLPAAKAKDRDQPISAASSQGSSCCANAETGAHQCCCCGSSTGAPNSCCAGHAKDSQSQPAIPASGLIHVSEAKCPCLPALWIVMGEICPPPSLLAWSPYLLPIGRVSSYDTSTQPILFAPLDPPPRLFSV
jgi:hypothetical protein